MQKHESLSVDLVETVIQKMLSTWPIDDWNDSEILVAVSGGPDSVALLRLLHRIKLSKRRNTSDLHVIHVNHQTRKDSDKDEQFVVDLAQSLDLPLQVVRRDGLIDEPCSSEEQLRDFRYDAILKTAHQSGIRFVATAHTADDQIETMLFRMARGTGLYGLKGIPVVRVQDGVSIVRPLLTTKKNQLIEVLQVLNQSFRIDESNSASHYTRNFLRNEIIPALEDKFGGQFDQSLQRLANQAQEHLELLDELSRPLIVEQKDGFQIDQIRQAHAVVARHALRLIWRDCGFDASGMTAEKWKQLHQLVCEEADAHLQLPGKVTAKIRGDRLSFERTETNR